MACGCNKNRGVYRNNQTVRPSSARGNITSAQSLRQQAVPPPHPQSTQSMANAEKRKVQALRRDAIKKALKSIKNSIFSYNPYEVMKILYPQK